MWCRAVCGLQAAAPTQQPNAGWAELVTAVQSLPRLMMFTHIRYVAQSMVNEMNVLQQSIIGIGASNHWMDAAQLLIALQQM